MFWKNKKLALLAILSTASFSLHAQGAEKHTLVTARCLINNTTGFSVLAKEQKFALIQADEEGIEKLAELKQQRKCGGFIDVSDEWQASKDSSLSIQKRSAAFLLKHRKSLSKPGRQAVFQETRYSGEVNQLFTRINPQMMWNNLSTLSNFKDRYANSANGQKAAYWLKAQVEGIAAEYQRDDVTIFFVQTGDYYKQPSLVVKVGTSDDPGIVVGGHMDTLSSRWENKPGADDDGSGSVTVLETARTILSSGMHFKKPIYFVWYAAEEMGLVGSRYVVRHFVNNHIPVDAVIQMDMTGYAYKNQPTMWLINDHVDSVLTNYLQTLIETYIKVPVRRTACGYACSDHASWTAAGFSASMPSESAFDDMNPDIHTSKDTMEKLSLKHMTNYTKLAVAFAVEMAEPLK